MSSLPTDPKKLRTRLRSYERALKKEKNTFGGYGDGSGKRYLVGPMYMLLGDLAGAAKSFGWFEEEFADDSGDPGHLLCWVLCLLHKNNTEKARKKLGQLMLLNPYAIPRLVGMEYHKLGISHGLNTAEPEWLDWLPAQFWELWTDEEKAWAQEQYLSKEFTAVRSRALAISHELLDRRVENLIEFLATSERL